MKAPVKNKKDKTPDEVYTQRFRFLLRLIRINKMLSKAKIIPAEK